MNEHDKSGVDRREFFKTAAAGLTAATLVMTPREAARAQAQAEKNRLDRIAACSYPIRYIFKSRQGAGRGAGGGAGRGAGGGQPAAGEAAGARGGGRGAVPGAVTPPPGGISRRLAVANPRQPLPRRLLLPPLS